MPNCSRVSENLVIVPSLYHTAGLDRRGHIKSDMYLERFISEEVDLFETFALDVSECVRLVPSIWESVKRDLTTNSKRQAIVCKFLLQDFDKSCSDTMYLNTTSTPMTVRANKDKPCHRPQIRDVLEYYIK